MPRLLIATNNPGKVQEFTALLADLAQFELCTPAQLGLALDPPETGLTYTENAAIKALAFAQAAQLPALADDSGLEVAALAGAPGLHSARYSPKPGASDADRRAHLLEQLAAQPAPPPWPARFYAAVCLALPDGRTFFAEGECAGEITTQERGSGGFGYDALFVVAGTGLTMAQLHFEDKNQISHRARAVQAIRAQLSLIR